MNGQRGFTLIEAMVAGIISVIIPGVVITLLRVNNTELANNSAQLRLSQIADLVSEDVQKYASQSAYVYSLSEAVPLGCPAAAPAEVNDMNGVVLCDAGKAMIKSYRVTAPFEGSPVGTLEERLPGGVWTPFVVGTDTVQMDMDTEPFHPKTGGIFDIKAESQLVSFNFRYNMYLAGKRATLPVQTETVICRNAVSRNW